MTVGRDYFETMHAANADPFRFRGSWYERRKRGLLLAALPEQRFMRGWEAGCSTGDLSAALATRCDRLLATDGSLHAVNRALTRLRGLPHVEVRQALHPDEWPEGVFDLIVVSEIGYYMERRTLKHMVARLAASLSPGGCLVACHWRHPFDPAPIDGNIVHALLAARLPWPRSFRYEDDDFLLEGWRDADASLAQREGRR